METDLWRVGLWTWGGVGGIESVPPKQVHCHAWSWTASGNLLCDAGSSKLMFCDSLGVVGGWEMFMYPCLIHVDVAGTDTMWSSYPPIKKK